MYLSHNWKSPHTYGFNSAWGKYTIVQMMHVSGHKTQKTFMDYIKLSSEEIADELVKSANTLKFSTIWAKSPPEPEKTARCGNYRLLHQENPDSVWIFAQLLNSFASCWLLAVLHSCGDSVLWFAKYFVYLQTELNRSRNSYVRLRKDKRQWRILIARNSQS